MNTYSRFALAVAVLGFASSAQAQFFSVGLRGTGSFPTGSFSQQSAGAAGNDVLIEGAKSGFGYGLDVGLGVGAFGLYAGFDHVKFDCQAATCQSDGKYTLQGVTAGVKIAPQTSSLFRPFVKGGITFNDLQGGYGGQSSNVLTTDKAPGYEIGGGLDLAFLGVLSVTPQVRYVGQNLKVKVPGVNAPAANGQGVNYFTFDLGLSVHTPFSGMGRGGR
jgi:hypothetical protein